MFGTIVVGVDGSGPAGRAVETMAKIAAGTKHKLVVVHGMVVYHSWGRMPRQKPRSKLVSRSTAMWRSWLRRECAAGTAVTCQPVGRHGPDRYGAGRFWERTRVSWVSPPSVEKPIKGPSGESSCGLPAGAEIPAAAEPKDQQEDPRQEH